MTNPNICIAYFSQFGHTRHLATTIAKAMTASSVNLIDVSDVSDENWRVLDNADAIVFGAPTYMGSTAAGFSAFTEEAATRWETNAWQDKIAAGFTIAVHPSGDKLAALQRISIFAAQMGMIWVGQAETGAPVHPDRGGVNRDGSWLGLMATEIMGATAGKEISEGDLTTANCFGQRIEAAVKRWCRP